MARTQEQRKAETRGRLLGAAADLFARRGFHAVSAEAVADAADRTTGAIQAHFGNKDGLMLALLSSLQDATVAQMTERLDAAGSLDDRLAALWTHVRTGPETAASSDRWLLLEYELWLHAARNPEVAPDLAGRYAANRAALGDAIGRWLAEDGLPAPADTDACGAAVMGLLLGLAMQHRLDPTAITTAQVVASVRAQIGVTAPATTGAPTSRRHDRQISLTNDPPTGSRPT